MKLFHAPTSPFVRKVMVMLHEAGGLDQITLIPASGTPLDPGTMPVDRNPLGKIPALETPDGAILYDSRVITRYLDDALKAGFYPAPPRLWDTLVIEATADGIAEAALLMRFETALRPEANRFTPWIEAQWQKVDRALTAIETRWMTHLAGPLDMGQIAVGCALGYLDLRHPDRSWADGHSVLADWWADFRLRPAMAATAPPG